MSSFIQMVISNFAERKDISQHCVNQSGYITTVSPDGKIIHVLIILFQYSLDGAILNRLRNVICDYLNIH